MNNIEHYRQKYQAQIDEWRADIFKLKSKATVAKMGTQLAMNKEIAALDRRLENYQAKFSELAAAQESTWDAAKRGWELTWESMNSALRDAMSRFRD